jgi:predicted O-methyltransferase YrrM
MKVYIFDFGERAKYIKTNLTKIILEEQKDHYPVINFSKNKIKLPFGIEIGGNFNNKIYFIKKIFGAFLYKDKTLPELNPEFINVNFSLKCIPLKGDLINYHQYTPNVRYLLESFVQIHQSQKKKNNTYVFFGAQGHAKIPIGVLQNLTSRSTIHIIGDFNSIFYNDKIYYTNEKEYIDYKIKYPDLSSSIINLAPFCEKHDIYIHGNHNYIQSISLLINNNIIPDLIFMQPINDIDYPDIVKIVVNKLISINPDIYILLSTDSYPIKKMIVDYYNPITLPQLKNSENEFLPISATGSRTHGYCITYKKIDLTKLCKGQFYRKPKSTFINYKYLHIPRDNPNWNVQEYDYDRGLDKDNQKVEIITKDILLSKFSVIYNKYKDLHDLFIKYINNDYIYVIFYLFLIKIENFYFVLNSNINMYECIFIHRIVKYYINNINHTNVNVLEIGCAYGVSGMIISNVFSQTKTIGANSFTSIDPNQNTQWHSVGKYNITQIINQQKNNTDYNLSWELIEKYSDEALLLLHNKQRKFDIIFIDGAHDYINVHTDIVLSNLMLKTGGIMIFDDVLHDGVKSALELFMSNNPNYQRIKIVNDNKISKGHKLFTDSGTNTNNPITMYAFIKN